MHSKVWMFSHLIDDEDLAFLQREFVSYQQAIEYYVLKEVRMDESDDEMIQLLETAIEKLKKMDEATFASLDLQKYLNDLQEDQKND